MKKIITFFAVFLAVFTTSAQVPAYYSTVNFADSGQVLKNELAQLITSTHTTFLSYTPGIWNLLEVSDINPDDSTEVLLIYGFDNNDGITRTDRSRAISLRQTGSSSVGFWNREHVFARSMGTPNLGTTGAGADGHHLAACDGQMNSSRGNRPFTAGSGNATTVGSALFYPGDEWKGDVARMMMYLYLRYPNQCNASTVGDGPITFSTFDDMPDIFLIWNAEDTVSYFERQRNEAIFNAQGNRNPFIDNPYLAERIWGGPSVNDAWNTFSTVAEQEQISSLYPNPSNGVFRIFGLTAPKNVTIIDYLGRPLLQFEPNRANFEVDMTQMESGVYHMTIQYANRVEAHRLLLVK
ncbi:MAG: endonuclease [Schleiferiaceae bacterium]|nr:endonuclease [Schleiferiaceae bacterium]